MENVQKSNFAANKNKRNHTRKNKKLSNIHQEYCLKRNQFYPTQPSPNLFCNRLEIRMKAYYESLKSSFKL